MFHLFQRSCGTRPFVQRDSEQAPADRAGGQLLGNPAPPQPDVLPGVTAVKLLRS